MHKRSSYWLRLAGLFVFLSCHAPIAVAVELVLQTPLTSIAHDPTQSGNRRYIALIDGKTVQVFDLATARIVAEFGGFSYLNSAALDWDGEKVAIAAGDTIKEYSVVTRKQIRELSVPSCKNPYPIRAAELHAMAYAQSGALLAVKASCAITWLPGELSARASNTPDLGVKTFSLQPIGGSQRFLALVQPVYKHALEDSANLAVVTLDLGTNPTVARRIVTEFAGRHVVNKIAINEEGSQFAILSQRGGKDGIVEIRSLASNSPGILERSIPGLRWGSKINGWLGNDLVVTSSTGVIAISANSGTQRVISDEEDVGIIYGNRLWVPNMFIANRGGIGSLDLMPRPGVVNKRARRVLVQDAVPTLSRGCYDAARHHAIFFTDDDKYVQVMDLDTGQPVRQYPRRGAADGCMVSPDGRWMVAWTENTAVLYDHAESRVVKHAVINGDPGFRLRDDAHHTLEFPANGSRRVYAFDDNVVGDPALLIGNSEGDVVRWSWTTGNVHIFSAPWNSKHRAISFAVRAAKHEIWLGDKEGNLHVFGLNNDEKPERVVSASDLTSSSDVLALAFSNDGSRLLAATFRHLKVIDANSGNDLRTLLDSQEPMWRNYAGGVTFFDNDQKVLMRGQETFSVLDIQSGELTTEPLPRFNSDLFGGNPRRALAIVTSPAAGIRLWDARGKRWLGEVLGGSAAGSFLSATTQGYFVGAGAELKRVAFRDEDRIIAAEDAFEAFYRPDIVQEIFSGSNAGGVSVNATRTLAEALREPAPKVILNMLKGAPSEPAQIILQAQLRDEGGGIGEVRLFRNGKLIRRWNKLSRGETPGHAAHGASPQVTRGLVLAANQTAGKQGLESLHDVLDWPADGKVRLPFYRGEGVYSLIAFNRRGTLQSLPGVVEQPTNAPLPREPRAVVLAVGINNYHYDKATLNFAERDALDASRLFARALRTQIEIRFDFKAIKKAPVVETITLLSKEATRENLLRHLRKLENRLLPQDKLVLFFAGHGVMTNEGYAFLTHDYDGELNTSSIISGQQLTDALARIPAESQLLVLDTCHAGGMDSLLRGLYDARTSTLAARTGVRLLASATSLQQALDGYKGNGLFTHVMLEALKDRDTDLNEDGLITMGELGTRLRRQVPQVARTVGHQQEPTLFLGNISEPVQKCCDTKLEPQIQLLRSKRVP